MYFSQIAKCICLKLQNVFVSNYKIYLYQIAKFTCLKLQNVFVSNCKMYLSQIVKYICLKKKESLSLEKPEPRQGGRHWLLLWIDGSAPFFEMPKLLPLHPLSFISGAPLWLFGQFVFLIVAFQLTHLQSVLQMHLIQRPGKSLKDKSHGHKRYEGRMGNRPW